jgi:hypothetical protein
MTSAPRIAASTVQGGDMVHFRHAGRRVPERIRHQAGQAFRAKKNSNGPSLNCLIEQALARGIHRRHQLRHRRRGKGREGFDLPGDIGF